jgi:2-polyprenyl-3-methyl-5-hydroxy-6-metoxy-1,4-benzoquinol methylase
MSLWSRYLLSRRVTNKTRWVIDNLLPPIVSDMRWFNRILARAAYGRLPFDLDFKERAFFMTHRDFRAAYEVLGAGLDRPSDATQGQREFLISMTRGRNVLEVGCGNGQLALEMARHGFRVWACDMSQFSLASAQQKAAKMGLSAKFIASDIVRLPWKDGSFDSVVTSHTLEHVVDLVSAMREIRRVAKHRIVIVVPCQKYKRYTIDYHLHFFPTEAQLQHQLGLTNAQVHKIDGDWGLVAELDRDDQPALVGQEQYRNQVLRTRAVGR